MVASRTIGWLGALGAVAALLVTGGCGCTEDSGGFIGEFFVSRSSAQVGIDIPAVEVPPPGDEPVKVDVMFLLDDSVFVTEAVAQPGALIPRGAILGEGVSPPRTKSPVAQEIFDDAVDELLAQVITDHGGDADDYDLAFGVSRFEDYASFVRSGPKASDPTETADPVDALARPFILNQPIVRRNVSLFAALFGPALERTAPGNGGEDPQDAQSALEALYQLATGDGFDGNGNGSTNESGEAGFFDTQTAPGTSGDVPAPNFVADGLDDDGEPVYTLGETKASGSIGGAGWRPNSIRLVVVFSDICTITMLESDLDRDGPISNTPNASDVPGEPDAGPRDLETVSSVQAFACTDGLQDTSTPESPVNQQAWARFGAVDGLIPVAPTGPADLARAAMLQETIDALNAKNIEVLCVGIRQQIDPGPNKPNVPGPTLPGQGEVAAIPDPSEPPNDKSPFTWMSAVAILTGARDTDVSDPDPRWIPDLPLVYNLTTVNPVDGPVTNELVEDLSDRIGAWLPYVDRGGDDPGEDPGWAYFTVVLDLENTTSELDFQPPLTPVVPEPDDPDDGYVSWDGATQVVRVRCYWEGTDAPDPLRVAWSYGLTRVVDGPTPPLLSVSPFNFTTILTPEDAVPGGENPTGGHDPADVPVPGAVSGQLTTTYPEIFEDTEPQDVVDAPTTVTNVTSGEAFFRDLIRGIPAGTDIDTMGGPIGSGDTPYPPLAP